MHAWIAIGQDRGVEWLRSMRSRLAEDIAGGVTVTTVSVEGHSTGGQVTANPRDLFPVIHEAIEALEGQAADESGALRACRRFVEV